LSGVLDLLKLHRAVAQLFTSFDAYARSLEIRVLLKAQYLLLHLHSQGICTPRHRFLILFVAEMFSVLYGQTAAALYAKAAGQNAQARQLYNASADTYYKANDAAAYDDWVRARNHWDYFYNRS